MGIKKAEFDAGFESVEKAVKKFLRKSYQHESVGIIYFVFFTFQYCVQKFSAP
jgi:hypothetical protein